MAFAGPGTVAVVSGASSGIGRRIVVELAAAGATVIGVARREALLVALADELGPNVRYRTCDVSDVDAYVAAVRSLEQEHGRIDVLVNAAARTEPVDAGLAGYRTVMETNFFAPLAAMLEVLPGMRTRRHGAIVNVSSDDGRAPGPGPGDYPASKAALTALTESLWFAARTDGVALHVLYPAFVPTPMGMGSVDRGEMALPPRAVRRTEEQVARLVLKHLGSDRVVINAARLTDAAPIAKALFPRLYTRARAKF
ncbi:MAG TPA: SDR family NAD(P)-dependent oxidoreductase [Mycobacteriales bacterium]|nr:SDR family NAD(P)-dependent oxidoreductase [Mycobacteriales bacterium]